jgi:dihydrofolate synthase / folylpolyglutamate synthase
MTYEEAVAYVSSLAPRGWRLGLDRMEEFVQRLDVQDALGGPTGPQFIHVAGTNGKGSVTAYLQSMLVESGYRTGAFYSPYVYDLRERVQLGLEMISKGDFADLTARLRPVGESLSETPFGGITEFEFKTGLAFQFWKEKRCDWVALEVGLGGRFDATNVITPRASVVVSIGLDHTSILGDTHAKIAFEKAGIIKAGAPVVVGEMPREALDVVVEQAREKGSPIWRFGYEVMLESEAPGVYRVCTPAGSVGGLRCGIRGSIQPHNMALAVAAMEGSGAARDADALAQGAEKARLPGRMETRLVGSTPVVLDGAHNAEAAIELRKSLEEEFPEARFVLVCGMVQGHEALSFLETIAPLVENAHVAPIDFHRTQTAGELREKLASLGVPAVEHGSVARATEAALSEAGDGLPVLVTGSFYLLAEAASALPKPCR